ncbi:Salt Induced Serine rich [Hibiscus trionum]|uniref:Salt Induced Serine rich n=1 Tax=Hibiscus trionum TaxID=183268 RepID=A0A9W7HNX4_HIBTR|nr:Salt Induced Serine rich [Hibiscus trionum]
MENKKQVTGSSSSLDHLLAPKDPSSSSSSTSSILGSIFPPPPKVPGRDYVHSGKIANSGWFNLILAGSWMREYGVNFGHVFVSDGKGQSSGTINKDRNSSFYHNETVEPSYLSSSIYYGGQENYSPSSKTTGAPQYLKREGEDDDPNGNNSSAASRGNWWQGSLYY